MRTPAADGALSRDRLSRGSTRIDRASRQWPYSSPVGTEKAVSAASPPSFDEDALRRNLSDFIAKARSLDEVRRWLLGQDYVSGVELADHLIKVYPPWREFRVTFTLADGSTTMKAVDVSSEDEGLRFHGIHDV